MAKAEPSPADGGDDARRLRHTLADRLFHWLSAVSVIILLGTSLLPVLGFEFAWVSLHWATGLVLVMLVLIHVVRATFWQGLATMWINGKDLRDGWATFLAALRGARMGVKVGGKYSLAQKAIHHAFSIVVLTAIGTGCLMLVKIDTPWWERDPYWLSDAVWGAVYVLHDLAALCLVTMVIVHIYFALRPEKLYLTRSMLLGWITGTDYREHYDTSRWQPDRD